jgi:hypothetical protein
MNDGIERGISEREGQAARKGDVATANKLQFFSAGTGSGYGRAWYVGNNSRALAPL